MKIDYYGLRGEPWRPDVDLEHELATAEAIARAKSGRRVIVKLWLLTDGQADLERLEAVVRAAVAPLGLM